MIKEYADRIMGLAEKYGVKFLVISFVVFVIGWLAWKDISDPDIATYCLTAIAISYIIMSKVKRSEKGKK